MAQTGALIDQLKKSLRLANKTYADVGEHIGLSEASVKRMFAQKNISLERLDLMCELMEIEISDLVKSMEQSRTLLSELSDEQEREIVANAELLLVIICLANHWTMDEITKTYTISDTDCIQLFAKLDRLKVIDLLPENRIRLLLAPNFKWRNNGPIQRFFQESVEAEFFKSRFAQPTERLICVNGMISDSSNLALQTRMQRLATEFTDTCNSDAELPLDQRRGNTLVLAIRRWEYSSFDQLRRR